MVEWSLRDARIRFSAVVNAALDGAPQTVTRRGKPTVVVIAVEDYRRLCCAEEDARPNFIEHLLAIPRGGPDDVIETRPLRPRDIEW